MKLRKDITAAALALSLVAGVALASTSDIPVQMPGSGQGYGMMKGQWGCSGFNGPGMGQKGMRGSGWMHHGVMMSPEMRVKQDAFLDATKELRKTINDKRFAYIEAKRNPDLTVGELRTREKELYTLCQKLKSKRLEFFKVEKV